MNYFILWSLISLFRTPYLEIPLDFSSGPPTVQVEIEGKPYSLLLNMGSSCEFTLKKEVLDSIPGKEFIGTHTTIGLNGEEECSSKFLLQRINLNNKTVIHPLVDLETSEDIPLGVSGRIGRKILQTRNLLIDFQKSRLFVLKDFQDLKTRGYSLKEFSEVPFEITRWGPVFPIATDFGVKRFFLNTESFRSGTRSEEKTSTITTSQFTIGKVDLGLRDLEAVDIPSALNDIDGYLGMDFFNNNVVFLDFQKRKAFIKPCQPTEVLTRLN